MIIYYNKMKRKNLIKILEDGFVETGKHSGHYKIYSKEKDIILYDPLKDKKIAEFNLNDLMKGTC